MNSRRSFLKQAALLSGAGLLPKVIPMSLQRAMSIAADPGSSFYDAEHVVFLMQENRSFDHMMGTLRGVRGFNDPRAYILPDGDKVWLQKDAKGNAYAPFHVDIRGTRITWQGGLPHAWPDQIAARNRGRYDRWIPEKTAMSLGYFDRGDLPFYYALADAFTICDHHFCSSLTGTTPNRLFFWTGTNRAKMDGSTDAVVMNAQADVKKGVYLNWGTFPEVLEDSGISWKIYQNEISACQLDPQLDTWLGNYGDNPLEHFSQYHTRLSAYFRKHGDAKATPPLSAEEVTARYERLSLREKNLCDKAFCSNISAPFDYLALSDFNYTDDKGAKQSIKVPAGDIFYNFRKDVEEGSLPTVSWLIAPEKFSDHASSPLYGSWYVSEALDILTQDEALWKKTIFIFTYDENDGYFDHMPPFVAPKPGDSSTGSVSEGIDTAADYEMKKDSPIGLGYRVPMIIASPWSRGGYVNSQVFDLSSSLMFLENFLSKKTGKEILCPNISSWRRAVCGDLSSVFRPAGKDAASDLEYLSKGDVISSINNAKDKPLQGSPSALSAAEIAGINGHLPFSKSSVASVAVQEKGTKKACGLPYQLSAECHLDEAGEFLKLELGSGSQSGAAFLVYTTGLYKGAQGKNWNYAVSAGDVLRDRIRLGDFGDRGYDLRVHGPNGFYRFFKGGLTDPDLSISCGYEQTGPLGKMVSGNIELSLGNRGSKALRLEIKDNSYNSGYHQKVLLASGRKLLLNIDLKKSSGWYDFSVWQDGGLFLRQYAGHVDTGEESITDPLMGGLL